MSKYTVTNNMHRGREVAVSAKTGACVFFQAWGSRELTLEEGDVQLLLGVTNITVVPFVEPKKEPAATSNGNQGNEEKKKK